MLESQAPWLAWVAGLCRGCSQPGESSGQCVAVPQWSILERAGFWRAWVVVVWHSRFAGLVIPRWSQLCVLGDAMVQLGPVEKLLVWCGLNGSWEPFAWVLRPTKVGDRAAPWPLSSEEGNTVQPPSFGCSCTRLLKGRGPGHKSRVG